MHELSVAQSLVEIATDEARLAGANCVNRVRVRIGAMRMIDALLIQDAWVIACEGTLCEEARLEVEPCSPRVICRSCGQIMDSEAWQGCCPQCGAAEGSVTGGDELELTGLDVELDDEAPSHRPQEVVTK